MRKLSVPLCRYNHADSSKPDFDHAQFSYEMVVQLVTGYTKREPVYQAWHGCASTTFELIFDYFVIYILF